MATGESHNDERGGPAVWMALAFILLAGVALRLVSFRGSLWLDELHTGWVVGGDFADVASRAMIGNQPPLPYWLLWIYVQFTGLSDASLRLPSLVASSAAILMAFVAARRWLHSSLAGLVAAAALAFEGNTALFFASEARVYAIVQLVAIVQLMAFEAALRTGSIRARTMSLLLAWLLFYSHYTTAMLFAAEILAWLVIFFRNRSMPFGLRAVGLDGSLFLLGCLPAMSHLGFIFERRENWEAFVERPRLDDVIAVIPHHQMLLILASAWLLWVGATRFGSKRPLLRWPDPCVAGLIIAWLVAPIFIAWALSQADIARLFHLRYLVYVLPAGGVLVAMLISMMPAPRTQWVAAISATVCLGAWHFLICYPVLYGSEPVRTENWRGAIAMLNGLPSPDGQPLFVASQLIEADELRSSDDDDLREYCLFPLHSAYPFDSTNVQEIPLPYSSPGKLSLEHQQLARRWMEDNKSVVFVVRGQYPFAKKVAGDVERSLDGQVRSQGLEGFGDVHVFCISRRR